MYVQEDWLDSDVPFVIFTDLFQSDVFMNFPDMST